MIMRNTLLMLIAILCLVTVKGTQVVSKHKKHGHHHTGYKQTRTPTKCITCAWTSEAPYENMTCAVIDDVVRAPEAECKDMETPYCQTVITFVNDMIDRVERGCTNGTIDLDQSSQVMPTHEKCSVEFEEFLNGSETTICHLACDNADKCNFQGPSTIMLCPGPCYNGKCNYSSGECVCHKGFEGEQCNLIRPLGIQRECIQCDSETNPGCHYYNESSPCPSPSHRYCAVVSVTRYNDDGEEIRSFLSKDCTDSYEVADECFITNDDELNEVEYTCISTCEDDGCNIHIPDGLMEGSGNETQPLRCVICDSDIDGLTNCAHKNTTDFCPSEATHCMSIVSYYLSEKTDLSYEADPDYQLDSVIRGCAYEELSTNCTNTTVGGSSLIKVNCTESCLEDGCNTGWPARPKCSQCSCSQCVYEDECNTNPPEPLDCSKPYLEYCTIQDEDRYIDADPKNNGYPRTLTRGCSYKSIGNSCGKSQYGTLLQSCNQSCTTDGCNLGYFPYAPIVFSGVATLQSSSHFFALLSLITIWLNLV